MSILSSFFKNEITSFDNELAKVPFLRIFSTKENEAFKEKLLENNKLENVNVAFNRRFNKFLLEVFEKKGVSVVKAPHPLNLSERQAKAVKKDK